MLSKSIPSIPEELGECGVDAGQGPGVWLEMQRE